MIPETRIISVRGLLKTLLRKWRSLLICALVLSVILGGFQAIRLMPKLKASLENEQMSAEETPAVELEEADVEEVIESGMVQRQEYIQNSVLIRLDPLNKPQASTTISVITADMRQNLTEGASSWLATEILDYYKVFLYGGIDWTPVCEKYGIQPAYLNELFTISDYIGGGASSGSLLSRDHSDVQISTSYFDEEGAAEILQYAIDQLLLIQDEVSEQYGEHELIVGNIVTATVADRDLLSRIAEIVASFNALATHKDNYEKNRGDISEASAKSAAKKPVKESLSKKSFVMSCVKYAALGFFGGAFVLLFIYMLYLFVAGKVLSASELNHQYHLFSFGVLPGKENLKKIDQLVRKIDSCSYSGKSWTECTDIISGQILKSASGKEHIAFVGDVSKEILDKTRQSFFDISDRAETIDGLGCSAESLKKFNECDAVILVSEETVSRYSRINEVMTTADIYGKDILGSIVIE